MSLIKIIRVEPGETTIQVRRKYGFKGILQIFQVERQRFNSLNIKKSRNPYGIKLPKHSIVSTCFQKAELIKIQM